MRGYWKCNNALLKDTKFNDSIINLANVLFTNIHNGYKERWEYFKCKSRLIAIKICKELKASRLQTEFILLCRLNELLSKENVSEEEQFELNKIHFQINELYLDLAKGAFIRSRAKWLEEGVRNSSYFFALEKRNGKRKSLSALNIDGAVCKDIVEISNFVSNLYSSKFDTNSCDSFLDKVQCCIPAIDDDYKSYCESGLKCEEVWKALQSMKKGKSPGIDGLSVEFYTHFWDTIKSPLVKIYKECIIQREMTVTMKQGIIYLIPKRNKDILSIDNWHLITLLTVDYQELEGISVLGREMKISQLADDTTLFLKDESQVSKALDLIYNCSCASGLKLNVSKCEIMPVHDLNNDSIENIPIKSTVKYLGIYITKNLLARQHLNFSSRIVKSQNILNSWLQRDLSLYGRVILSKAEGLSHFVYPSLSLFVENKAKEINNIFLKFVWKNKAHKLKRKCFPIVEQMEVLIF